MPRKNVGLVVAFGLLLNVGILNSSLAASYCTSTRCTSETLTNTKDAVSGLSTTCSITDTVQFGGDCLRHCNTCKTGYTKTAQTYSAASCSNTITVYNCVSNSSGGGDDDDDSGSGGVRPLNCTAGPYSSAMCGTTFANSLTGCSASSSYCFGTAAVKTCNTCRAGYTATTTTLSVGVCSNKYSYTDCVSSGGGVGGTSCTTDADCGTDIDWFGTGATQTQVLHRCLLGTCTRVSNARCAPGYYDEKGNGQGRPTMISCVPCPEPGTSSAAAKSINFCYVPANTTLTDTSGVYSFSSDCSYMSDLVPIE